MVAGLNIELQACRLPNRYTNPSVHPSRTYSRAAQNHRSVLARISPPAPCGGTCSARWRSKVFQFGMPKIPTSASNGIVTEEFSISVEHIVRRQSVDIVGRVDGGDRTREIWRRWRIKQAKGVQGR